MEWHSCVRVLVLTRQPIMCSSHQFGCIVVIGSYNYSTQTNPTTTNSHIQRSESSTDSLRQYNTNSLPNNTIAVLTSYIETVRSMH